MPYLLFGDEIFNQICCFVYTIVIDCLLHQPERSNTLLKRWVSAHKSLQELRKCKYCQGLILLYYSGTASHRRDFYALPKAILTEYSGKMCRAQLIP